MSEVTVQPLSSKLGAHKTVEARFWPWLEQGYSHLNPKLSKREHQRVPRALRFDCGAVCVHLLRGVIQREREGERERGRERERQRGREGGGGAGGRGREDPLCT